MELRAIKKLPMSWGMSAVFIDVQKEFAWIDKCNCLK
jgi:hypothetical protein